MQIPRQRCGSAAPGVRFVYGSPAQLYAALQDVEAEGLVIRSVVRAVDGGWRVRVAPRAA